MSIASSCCQNKAAKQIRLIAAIRRWKDDLCNHCHFG